MRRVLKRYTPHRDHQGQLSSELTCCPVNNGREGLRFLGDITARACPAAPVTQGIQATRATAVLTNQGISGRRWGWLSRF
jgi:hypothetical protein